MQRRLLPFTLRANIGLALMLAGLAFSPPLGAADGTSPRKIASLEGIIEYDYPNGLKLLLFPDQSQSKVTVNLTVLVGSRVEGYGETGMAHLLEHMVFKGTPRHPQVPRALQEHGAVFNGSTNADRVNYFETLAATDENLEFAIDLEADRLVNSFIRKEDLDSEMTVVRNEFERGENSAARVLRERIESVAYDWHNYGKPTIGNRSDIERVPIDNLQAFYRKYYQPDNVVLIIAGKLDEAKTLGWVGKYFGAIPRPTRVLPTTWTDEPAQDGERTVMLRRVGNVGSVALAYHIPAAGHEDAATLQVVAGILTARPSGRLLKHIVGAKKASGASAQAGRQHDPSLFIATAEVPDATALATTRDALIATVEGVAKGELTVDEVNRAKQQILKAREQAANDTAQIGISLSEWAAAGDWRLYFLFRDRIEQVTPEAVQTVAARYFRRSNRTVGIFLPAAEPDRVPIPAAPALAPIFAAYAGRAAAAEGEAFDPTPGNIEARVQRLELPEGVKVTLLPKKTRGEEVHVVLSLRYGNEHSLRNLDTAGSFLPGLMLQATKQLTAQQLRDELDRLGATLTTGAGSGRSRGGRGRGTAAPSVPGVMTFSVQAKRDTLPEVLEVLRQVLREPTLPEKQFELAKRERIAALEATRSEPATLAPRMLQRELTPYPKEDIRYQPTIEEAIERLRGVQHPEVARIYREFIGAGAGELTIVGDFDPETCLPVLRKTFEGWKAAQPYARISLPLPPAANGTHLVINTPDKANATYVAGLMLPLRDDDPDYPALVLGNYILGSGTLASRLGVRIRQQEGLSYGVTSSLNVSPLDQRATFSVTAICNPENMPRLEQCVREEIDRIRRDGVTADELAKARQGYLDSLKVGRGSDVAIASLLTTLRFLDRTMAWQSDFEKKLAALTPDDVGAALRRRIDPAKLVVVVAGDLGAKAGNGATKPAAGGRAKPGREPTVKPASE